MATEALTVLASRYGQELISSILSPVVDFKAYSQIQDRFSNPQLPILRDNCLDFPRIMPASVPTFSISSPAIETPIKPLEKRAAPVIELKETTSPRD